VVAVKKTKNSTNVYKEKLKLGGLCLGLKILQVQPVDGFFERVSFERGQDVCTFSEAMSDDERAMP
jgi:hypothetical protein